MVIIYRDHVHCFGMDISLVLQTREISLLKNNSHDLHRVITHSLVLVIGLGCNDSMVLLCFMFGFYSNLYGPLHLLMIQPRHICVAINLLFGIL